MEKFNLSNEVMETTRGNKVVNTYLEEDVKEKIQNAQKRLKEVVGQGWRAEDIDEIFKEEFGEKLI